MLRRRVFCGAVLGSVSLCLMVAGRWRSVRPPDISTRRRGRTLRTNGPTPCTTTFRRRCATSRRLRPPRSTRRRRRSPRRGFPFPPPSANDPVIQATPGAAAAPALGLGFEGIGQGFSGPSGSFTVTGAPPDPNGAVGPNHFVEIVNTSFAVFNKTGTALYGPVPTNTLWSGFGGGCQTNNDGDATVEYDRLADRWIISQFSVTTTPYLQCVAVSTSGDPTGSYYRYSFQYSNFPDYPKLGVWPDAYYKTFNLFTRARTQSGAETVRVRPRRDAPGAGCYPAVLQRRHDVRRPASVRPRRLDAAARRLAELRAQLRARTASSSGSSTSTGRRRRARRSQARRTSRSRRSRPRAAAAAPASRSRGRPNQLDSLADRLMYRLAYRNFGDHEALVVNHSVTAGSSVGVRWYELRDPGGTPTVYQQGTYAPDSELPLDGQHRDGPQAGDIALGYSVSSSSLHPGSHYTGRLAGRSARRDDAGRRVDRRRRRQPGDGPVAGATTRA